VEVLAVLAGLGIDMSEVGSKLEVEGLAAFQGSMDSVLARLGETAGASRGLSPGGS
jgi:hypothetical protein